MENGSIIANSMNNYEVIAVEVILFPKTYMLNQHLL